MFGASIIVTQQCVTTRRSLAAGTVSMGAGIGIAAFSQIVSEGIRWRGWRGALWLEAAILLASVSCAALVGPSSTTQIPISENKMKEGVTELDESAHFASFSNVSFSKGMS